MPYLTATYDNGVVLASVLLAMLASYVALDLAQRVRIAERHLALAWWLSLKNKAWQNCSCAAALASVVTPTDMMLHCK